MLPSFFVLHHTYPESTLMSFTNLVKAPHLAPFSIFAVVINKGEELKHFFKKNAKHINLQVLLVSLSENHK